MQHREDLPDKGNLEKTTIHHLLKIHSMAHSIHEGRYLFQNNPIQKYPKLKELPGRGLLNIKNQ